MNTEVSTSKVKCLKGEKFTLKKLLCAFTILIILVLLTVLPLSASPSDMSKPDGALSVIKVFAYENCLILGDQLFVAQINIPYTTVPSIPSSSAFLGRMVSNVGVEVGSTPINSYFNSGYSYNTFAVYFPTAVVPWNIAPVYTLFLDGSPTLNWLGTSATTTMSGYVNSAGADKTAEANNGTANDMALLTGVLSSTSYFGSVYDFGKLTVNIGTSGVGVYTTVWEYWNGTGWAALTDVVDGTSYFMAPVGNHDVTFTIPTDWAATIVAPVAASQMWLRVRVNSYTSMGTPSLGTQSWVNGNSAYPTISVPSTSFTWNTTTTIAQTQNYMYGQTITWADTLGSYWSLPLTTFSGSVKVFSAYGQTYFPDAIPGLQQMCPQLFATTVSTPKYVDKTGLDSKHLVDGAVADNGGVQTTETAGARSIAANDMTLLPAVPALGDAYYFGLNYLWDTLLLHISTQGVGIWSVRWEYWNGGAWTALSGVADSTDSFRAAIGVSSVIFTRPTGWTLRNVNAAGVMYWIRARVLTYNSVTTSPLGAQAWCVIKSTKGATTVTSTWPLDWTGIAHYLGFSGTDAAFRGLIALIGIFFITTVVTTKSAQAAVPVAFALLVGFSAIGWVTPVLAAGVAFAAVLVFGLVFLLGKAPA